MSDPLTIVVTGANRGIGREVARQLAAAGHRVIATARRLEAAREVAAELAGDVRPAVLDLAEPASIEAFARHHAGGVDVLVNNAAVSLQGFDGDVVRDTLRVNVRGPAQLIEGLLPSLPDGGRIVNVSSGMGTLDRVGDGPRASLTDPGLTPDGVLGLGLAFEAAVRRGGHSAEGWPSSAYVVSKNALNALSRVYARQLADDPRRILVVAVCPGWVRTDMGGASAPRSAREGASGIVWAAVSPDVPGSGFYRDERPIDW